MKRSGLIAAVAATVLVFSLRQDLGAAPPANSAETYKQLNLFGEVFESVSDVYFVLVLEVTLVESAIMCFLTSLYPNSY
jgi:carboxyl-terminal processing protease